MPWPAEALAAALAVVAAAAAPHVTDMREIALHSGINPVERFAPDGRDGVIVRAAPTVEVADQTHTDFMALVKPARPGEPWAVARVLDFDGRGAPAGGASDMVSDYPHTGEDQVSSLRFVRARVDGAPAVLLVRARRDFVLPIPDPSPVTVDVFRLTIEPDFGEEVFKRVSRRRYPGCYGNTDLALKAVLGLTLPAGVEGPAGPEPCPASGKADRSRPPG